MADSKDEYLPVGAIVQCVTCLGEKIEGEVVAFDHIKKILALKTSRQSTGSKKSRTQQLQMINVNLVTDLNVVQEAPPGASSQVPVPNFSYTRITKRGLEEASRKRRSICPDSVSLEGQKLFVTIRKTIEDVQWDGDNILVMSAVTVSPPYKSENIFVNDNQREQQRNNTRAQAQGTADHVRKIIDQFWSKQRDDTTSAPDSNSNDSRKSEPPDSLKRISPTSIGTN